MNTQAMHTMPWESAVTALRVVAPRSVGGCGGCGRVSLSPLASSLALARLPRSCLLLAVVREEAVGALSARIREGYEARFGVVPPLFVTRAGTSARVLLQPDSDSAASGTGSSTAATQADTAGMTCGPASH
jgi:hypothetical protein